MIQPASLAGPPVYFGGPDQPPRLLRDLLQERIDAVPSGGSVDWITYYFRDERLAQALINAHRRGVRLRICLDGWPRHKRVNDGILSMLSGPEGIGEGLRVVRHLSPGHLHTKLYCFSHPHPVALVGSFNPSGDQPEDPDILAKIGDQDRGHNLLLELAEPKLLETFLKRIAAIHAGASPFGRLYAGIRPDANAGGCQAYFFPRLGTHPLSRRFAKLRHGVRLRVAASHFGDFGLARHLAALVRRGASVEVLTHHSARRSPRELVGYLRANRVRTYRYEHPEELPMHAKFILAESDAGRWCAFGSYNLNWNSRWLNQELLLFSNSPELWETLDGRWKTIASEPWCKE